MADPGLTARLRAARLYVVSSDGDPARQARTLCAAIDGGADIVQLRNKLATPGELVEAARIVREHAHAAGALFIVNDHVDLAAEVDADGVHVGQDDTPVPEALAALPGKIVGQSSHSLEQAVAAVGAGATYIGVGPVFATPTKAGRPAVGTDLVVQVAKRLEGLPWFAIGGIDERTLPSVLAAGARRVAVVRAVSDAPDPAAAAARLLAMLPEAVAVGL
ncbi:MAG: thiamine-phosphate pyrophosphorylase [Chloroflexota bacterium]|jgi:thiamine-phosphate pyrophosphorylase|nr:thiamine-phosphate pyrophosphorylase [Chloroflexota bacterium]